MTGDLFKEWIGKLEKMHLIDNCPGHPQTDILNNVNIIFLPLNSTSILQPTDQEVIGNLKVHYRKRVICLWIRTFSAIPKMNILVSSFNLSEAATLNCSKKANFSAEE